MEYKAITYFTDGEDSGYPYEVGDKYPREGYTPTPERVRGLLTNDNKRGIPLIAEVQPKKAEEPKTEKAEKVKAAPKKETKKKTTKKK